MILAVALTLGFRQSAIDLSLAKRYFQEAQWASDDDGGKLWGKAIYGPMLFVDPRTRTVVANQADSGGTLKAQEGVYVGRLPPEMGIANAPTEWLGTRWAMVRWPPGGTVTARRQLLLHESFHRVQPELGFKLQMQPNAHLDTVQGRTWLELEWRALAAALTSAGDARRNALQDALLFRAYRRSLFPQAAEQEDRMEMNEGLAEYTGMKLRGTSGPETRRFTADTLAGAEDTPSFPTSFAYNTGPAYGLLMDTTEKPWRPDMKPTSSLSATAQALFGITLPPDVKQAAQDRMAAYGGQQLLAKEEDREKVRAAHEKDYLARLVDGPVLLLPMHNSNFTFDPNTSFPLGAHGTVFPTFTMSDDWGTINVTAGGLLMAGDFQHAYVPASGEGWKLTLKPGWNKVAGARAGDWTLARG